MQKQSVDVIGVTGPNMWLRRTPSDKVDRVLMMKLCLSLVLKNGVRIIRLNRLYRFCVGIGEAYMLEESACTTGIVISYCALSLGVRGMCPAQ